MKFNLFKLQNFSWFPIPHFIGKLSSYSVFCSLVLVSYAFVFVLLGSDRACLNTSISCWGNSTTHIRVIERSQMLSPSIISLETADYFLLNWLIWLLLLKCICTVLIKPKNQNIPKENISVIEKVMMYIFFYHTQTTPPPPEPLWPIYADCQSRGNLQTLQKENASGKSMTTLLSEIRWVLSIFFYFYFWCLQWIAIACKYYNTTSPWGAQCHIDKTTLSLWSVIKRMNIANMSDIKATSFLIPPINSFLDMGIGWVDYHEMWK